MYVLDTFTLHALLILAAMPGITCLVLGITIARGKRCGGIMFCKLGRLGFSFYFRKPQHYAVVENQR